MFYVELVDAWRLERPDDTSLEEKVKVLFIKLRRVHEAASSNSVSKSMVSMINEVFKKYFADDSVSHNSVTAFS